MTSGLHTETGSQKRSAKPNGRARDDAMTQTKELTASNGMDDLLSKFMALSGPQLRAVFDRAVVEHNALVEKEKERHSTYIDDADATLKEAREEINDLNKRIAALNSAMNEIGKNVNDEVDTHNTNLENLDQRRALIENMMTLFKHKLDGFSE